MQIARLPVGEPEVLARLAEWRGGWSADRGSDLGTLKEVPFGSILDLQPNHVFRGLAKLSFVRW